jgi:molybdate transport system ATP-binding protein
MSLHAQFGLTRGSLLLDVDLRANEGETMALVGPNGAGKTTCLHVLAGLLRVERGRIQLGGEMLDGGPDGSFVPPQQRGCGFVFQDHLLFPHLSVLDNVAFGLRSRGTCKAEAAAVARQWLERVGLADRAAVRSGALSGGQAQRVALARALVLEPEVLLLDEPFAALDEPSRDALLPDVGAILRHDRVTTFLVTHDRGEAQALADRVAVLMAGRIVQLDATARVFQSPVSEEVARFVGVETLVTGRVIARDDGLTVVEAAGRKLEVAAAARVGETVRLGLRPEDVTLVLPTELAPLSSARNYLPGTIVRVTASAPSTRVVVDVGFPLVATVTARSVADLGLTEGGPIVAAFKASAVHLIGPG